MSKRLIREICQTVWRIAENVTEGNRRTRAVVREEIKRLEIIIMTAAESINSNLDNLAGDLDTLTAAAQGFKDALDAALADQEVKVQEAVTAAVADARAEFDASLEPLVAKSAALAARTPDAAPEDPAPVEPPAEPVEP